MIVAIQPRKSGFGSCPDIEALCIAIQKTGGHVNPENERLAKSPIVGY